MRFDPKAFAKADTKKRTSDKTSDAPVPKRPRTAVSPPRRNRGIVISSPSATSSPTSSGRSGQGGAPAQRRSSSTDAPPPSKTLGAAAAPTPQGGKKDAPPVLKAPTQKIGAKGGPPSTSAERDAPQFMSLLERPRLGYDLLTSVLPTVDLEARRKVPTDQLILQTHREVMEFSCSMKAISNKLVRYAEWRKDAEEQLKASKEQEKKIGASLEQKIKEFDEVASLREKAQLQVDELLEEKSRSQHEAAYLKKRVEDLRAQLKTADDALADEVKSTNYLKRSLQEEKMKNSQIGPQSIELYKTSDEFQAEVMECSMGAVDFGFSMCRNLIGKLFPDLDLSRVTRDTASEMGVSGDEVEVEPTEPTEDTFCEGEASEVLPSIRSLKTFGEVVVEPPAAELIKIKLEKKTEMASISAPTSAPTSTVAADDTEIIEVGSPISTVIAKIVSEIGETVVNKEAEAS